MRLRDGAIEWLNSGPLGRAESIHPVLSVGCGCGSKLATYVVEKDKPFLVVVD